MDLDKAKAKMLGMMPHNDMKTAIESAWKAGDARSNALKGASANPGATKTDIRSEYKSVSVDINKGGKAYTIKLTAGWSGPPKLVASIRNPTAQRNMSAGTGKQASHLAGADRGAPGGSANMALNRTWLNKSVYVRDFENMERGVHKAGGRVFSAAMAIFEKGGKHGGAAVPFHMKTISIIQDKGGKVSIQQRNFGHFSLGDNTKDKGSQQLKANRSLGDKVKPLTPGGKAVVKPVAAPATTLKSVGPNVVRFSSRPK